MEAGANLLLENAATRGGHLEQYGYLHYITMTLRCQGKLYLSLFGPFLRD